jgi:hypothetical protein
MQAAQGSYVNSKSTFAHCEAAASASRRSTHFGDSFRVALRSWRKLSLTDSNELVRNNGITEAISYTSVPLRGRCGSYSYADYMVVALTSNPWRQVIGMGREVWFAQGSDETEILLVWVDRGHNMLMIHRNWPDVDLDRL